MDREDFRSVSTTRLAGVTVFRYANYDTPFWARNNRSSGRWNVAGQGSTQYFSLTPDGAWADLARRENLRTEGELALVRMPIWAVHLDTANLADYSTFEKAEAAGFVAEALIDDDYSRCQDEARLLQSLGYCGVVAPSAALPGCVNVTLFGRRVRSSWGVPTKLASAMPCCVVAVGGPAPGLASKVRHFGDSHSGYEDYLDRTAEAARERRIDEPPSAEPEAESRVLRATTEKEAAAESAETAEAGDE